MKRPLLFLGALAVMGAGLVPLLARTPPHDVRDTNDTRGVMDVERVHVNTHKPPRFSIVTFDSWTAAQVWDAGYLLVHFDSFGDKHFDYYANVSSDGRRLIGRLYRDRPRKADYRVGRLQVIRQDQRHVRVRVPLDQLDLPKKRGYYRWYVDTLFTSEACPKVCIDRVPDSGSVTEEVGPTQTTILPTPTPSIT
ncbi:MAG: hypothetical protein QOK47_1252 [Actinomycetota bacterium]|nr:hypothetical protein [Actinomycetota bacterium]